MNDRLRKQATTARPDRGALTRRRLKTWIRLLRVTRRTEADLRAFLRLGHDTTLPRFDVMAALWRRRDGLTMSELSRMLLVSNGNATAVVDRLARDGLVLRTPSADDRRIVHVALTPEGLARFEGQAKGHAAEVDRIFGKLSAEDLDRLSDILKRLDTAE